jgi:hypothetical protein
MALQCQQVGLILVFRASAVLSALPPHRVYETCE